MPVAARTTGVRAQGAAAGASMPGLGALDVLRQQFAKRGNRLLGPVFLPERKAAIDQDIGDDGNAQLPHALRRAAGLGEKG